MHIAFSLTLYSIASNAFMSNTSWYSMIITVPYMLVVYIIDTHFESSFYIGYAFSKVFLNRI